MSAAASFPAPEISLIVPVVERHGDLRRLFEEYAAELVALGRSFEALFVVDYREREVLPELRRLQAETEHDVTLVLLGGTFGESSALTVGLERARGSIVVTTAAYFQVEPSGLGAALAAIDEGADLVAGRRHPRRDTLFNRLQAFLFHRLVGALTSTRFRDVSCGFRVMRRRVAEEIQIYGGLHRFLPVLAHHRGFRVVELPLGHRREDFTTRYYGVAVYLKRLLDVLTIFFLVKFTRRPLRFFGLLGLALSSVGCGITLYLGIYRILGLGPIAGRPLLLLGVLLMVLGIQTLSLGLIGEIIIFTHARAIRDYQIAEVIERPARTDAVAVPPPR